MSEILTRYAERKRMIERDKASGREPVIYQIHVVISDELRRGADERGMTDREYLESLIQAELEAMSEKFPMSKGGD